MRTQVFTLPNGFTDNTGTLVREIELRKLDGNDEDFILDKQEMRKGNILNRLIKRVTVRLGTTVKPDQIERLYDERFLVADTTYVLVSLRLWGIGRTYRFEASCPRCEKIGKHRLDLSTLKLEPQPEEARGKTEFVETVTAEDEDPVVVRFRPLFVKDEPLLLSIRSDYPKDKASRELLMQVLEMDGKHPTVDSVKALPMRVRNAIRQTMDAKSGGINTELLMECRSCGRSFKDNMPIDIRSFFFPAVASSPDEMEATPYLASGTTPLPSPDASAGSPPKSGG